MKPGFRIFHILLPLGWLYGLTTGIRNRMFDNGILKSRSFGIPVIDIGNITVGGTGKTPHTQYIAALLKDLYRTAILSRGYGRDTKGFIMADAQSDSRTIGDEPLQMHRLFPDLDLAVSQDRVPGIERLIKERKSQVILLDDAYQHRRVKPSLNILLVNYGRNILSDAMLPAGRLRESAKGRRRADIIIVTKCPADLTGPSMDELASALAVNPSQHVFFTTLKYDVLTPFDGISTPPAGDCPVLAVAGIADPAPMEAELRKNHSQVSMLTYPDHHRFTLRELSDMENRLQGMPQGAVIITTAKDAARLWGMDMSESLRKRIFILPVMPAFLRDSDLFDNTIINHIESFIQQ